MPFCAIFSEAYNKITEGFKKKKNFSELFGKLLFLILHTVKQFLFCCALSFQLHAQMAPLS